MKIPYFSWRRLSLVLAATVFSAAVGPFPGSGVALACAFDLRKPERTEIDWIVDAETLVLARPDPEDAFSYQVIEVLRGGETDHDLPFLVTSLNNRMLTENPEHAVLFRKTVDDRWAQVAYIDDDFREILETTLSHADQWFGLDYHPSRFAMFEALQNNANPKLRDLAIRELDKSSYEMLRELDVRFTPEELLAQLWTPAGYPYQSIRVLLLGLSDSDAARKEIHSYFARIHDWDTAKNIGAFSAAFIELDGLSAVQFLDKKLLSDPDQPPEKLQGIISALAVHRGVARQKVSEAIDAALAGLVEERPQLAPVVAQQFAAFSNWSQVEPLTKLVKERRLMTTADLMAVSVYLAQARSTETTKDVLPDKG